MMAADLVLVKEFSKWRPYLSCGAVWGCQSGGARLWEILDASSIVGCNLPSVRSACVCPWLLVAGADMRTCYGWVTRSWAIYCS